MSTSCLTKIGPEILRPEMVLPAVPGFRMSSVDMPDPAYLFLFADLVLENELSGTLAALKLLGLLLSLFVWRWWLPLVYPVRLRFVALRFVRISLNAGRLPTMTAGRDLLVDSTSSLYIYGLRMERSAGGKDLHIETASVDQTMSKVRFTNDAGTRIWFARMMEKAIMTKESVKTQTRPSFCFAEILTLYINLSGMAMTVVSVSAVMFEI